MIWTIIIFILVLGVLVLVHEFGHFYAAKKSGMKVLEFGFGFPPRCIGIQKKDGRWRLIWGSKNNSSNFDGDATGQASLDSTVYSINWIPFGGFVKILGENNEHEEDPRSFINRPFWGRFLTLVAGVAMNFILAWVLISIGLGIGLPASMDNPKEFSQFARIRDQKIHIEETVKDFPAQKAGIIPGDIVEKIDNQSFNSAEETKNYVKSNSGKKFVFQINRAGEKKNITVESLANPKEGEGTIGVMFSSFGMLYVPWYIAPAAGVKATFIQTQGMLSGFYQLITGKIALEHVGGPVKIAELTGKASNMGFIFLMQLTAILSLNLAILNILPFPALDGGRVLMLLIEKARRKKNNQKVEQWINTVGFLFLIGLMILVTIKDIRGLF